MCERGGLGLRAGLVAKYQNGGLRKDSIRMYGKSS
ncbi:unnamed protein product [Chondrus crispus]|uniref:Uncharacterized protein n=1 Tax=Chondrus crispus TaxID=2769 RepID=R7Q2V5_CHOCR|nr:unnamed protein product [Chondrus crispus]CDF32897.1 unnamed protein product [Chondrus crispus]|eukprot:XP_005712698.1 unnamed protein product [Chondrus crispus]